MLKSPNWIGHFLSEANTAQTVFTLQGKQSIQVIFSLNLDLEVLVTSTYTVNSLTLDLWEAENWEVKFGGHTTQYIIPNRMSQLLKLDPMSYKDLKVCLIKIL